MLQRFLKLKTIIPKVLIELAQSSIFLADAKVAMIEDLVQALEVIEVGTLVLCCQEATLSPADQILKYMLGNF